MTRPDHAAEIAALARQVPPESFECALRRRFGGETLRISERPPVTPEQVDAGLRQGKPVSALVGELGVGRSTIYRMLRARNRLPMAGGPT